MRNLSFELSPLELDGSSNQAQYHADEIAKSRPFYIPDMSKDQQIIKMMKESEISPLKACFQHLLTACDFRRPFISKRNWTVFENMIKIENILVEKNMQSIFGRLDIGISKMVRGNYTVLVIFIHPLK